jgi:hypothetical protein
MNELSEADKNRLTRGHCPKCGERGFVLGPQDGASMRKIASQLCACDAALERSFVMLPEARRAVVAVR